MLNKRYLSLLLCVIFTAMTFLPATTAKAADGELTVDHSTEGQLAAEITAAAGGNESTYTKLKINIGSVDLSGDNTSGDWNTLVGLTTLLPNADSLELVYTSGSHTIPFSAMNMATWLKSVIFTNAEGQLTGIGSNAFYHCTGLSGTLTIPSSVTSIGNFAFAGCAGLTGTLTIPSAMTTIGSGAFVDCAGLTGTLTIPSTVTAIGNGAFAGCSKLTVLSLPASGNLTIGSKAFEDCTGLTGTLTIPSSVTSIGESAFEGCTELTALSLPVSGNLTSIGSCAFYCCNKLSGSLTIPSSVTSIGGSAFYGCSKLSGSLTIPSSVTAIENSTFYGCTGLNGTLTIPSSVTSIGISAFYGCYGLTALSLPAAGSLTTIGDYAFNGCTGLRGTLAIPSSVTSIGEGAFRYTWLSGALTIPSSVVSIGKFAFQGCELFTSLSLPASGNLLTIGTSAFQGCSRLSGTLIIPSSVTTIGINAFYGCTGFKGTVVIPSSVTSILIGAFEQCTGLTALVFKNTVSAPAMSAGITDTPITAYYPASIGGSYTSQSGFPANRAAYGDSSAIITSMTINGVNGVIDQTAKIIKVDLPAGTNLSALKPDIGFIGSSVDPVSGAAQDFSSTKRTCTVTPVSGTPVTYSIYIMGRPAVSGSNTLSGTVGDVGDQTVTATVSAAGIPEIMTLKASVDVNESTAIRKGNGQAKFYFSGSLFDDFAVGRYPITVTAGATTYNYAIATTQIGTLTVKPIAPVIKTATVNGSSVTITWDVVTGANGYKVYSYDPNTKAYTEIASTAGSSYTQNGLAQGSTYYYAVSSYQTVSSSPIYSDYSAAASAATPAPPTPPADPPKPADPTPITPADPPKPADPAPNPSVNPPVNPQVPAPTPAPATIPHVGTFLSNKVPAKANAGTAITIVPSAAPKGYTMQSVSYSSSNPSVATVDANGNVTFLAGGKVTIVTKIVS